jgi:hypothetical protein
VILFYFVINKHEYVVMVSCLRHVYVEK